MWISKFEMECILLWIVDIISTYYIHGYTKYILIISNIENSFRWKYLKSQYYTIGFSLLYWVPSMNCIFLYTQKPYFTIKGFKPRIVDYTNVHWYHQLKTQFALKILEAWICHTYFDNVISNECNFRFPAKFSKKALGSSIVIRELLALSDICRSTLNRVPAKKGAGGKVSLCQEHLALRCNDFKAYLKILFW